MKSKEQLIEARLKIKKVLCDTIEFYSPHTKSEQLDNAANGILSFLSGYDAAGECDKEKLANDLLIEIIKKDPVKMLQFYTLYLGKELVKSNAGTMDLTQECDVENKRYKVSVTATISPLPQPPNQ